MKKIIQLEIESSEDFKREIVREVVEQIKDLAFNNQKVESNINALLSRNETAEMLNISLTKLWEITKKKLLPVYKIGGKVMYKKKEIESFINMQSNL